ncbi:MAG TPA: radical SAM protein [bacterium]|nr:radical SAM protein [bacterium]
MIAAKALLKTAKFHALDRAGLLRPRKLRLAVTSRCNARCAMCNAWQRPLDRELTLDDYTRLFNKSAKFLSSIRHVSLTGGEPTLRDDLVDIVRLVTERFPVASININTNGLLSEIAAMMTRELLAFRKQALVIVSLDGMGDVHDMMRGVPGAFDKANSTIESLLSLKRELSARQLKIEVNYTATNANAAQYEQVLNYCNKRGIKPNLIIPMSGVLYRTDGQEPAVAGEEMEKLTGRLKSQLASSYNLNRAIVLDLLEGRGRQFDCWAGRLLMFVDADGSVYPNGSCPARFRMGNVLEDSYDLADIFRSRSARRIIEKARGCRECQVACETGVTLRLSETFYAHRRQVRRQ